MQGVRDRDAVVFEEVRKRGIPILMVTSGGYQVRAVAAGVLAHNIGTTSGCSSCVVGLFELEKENSSIFNLRPHPLYTLH